MKKFLTILIFASFWLQPAWTNSIEDFEIEGMSIGNSALEYFNEDNLKTNISNPPNLKDSSYSQSCFNRSENTYDRICVAYKKNSKQKIIESIQAQIIYNEDVFHICRKKQKEIDQELSSIFENLERKDWGERKLKSIAHIDPKAYFHPITYEFPDESRSQVGCYNIKSETILKVAVYTYEFGLVISK
tara:strand:+ start:1238 stop:1801 length:564 start_codon:yes stop_codon:yes gene_type:complete